METTETKIRRGQAFNLAVNDAISKAKQNDPKYIYQQFIYYYNLADIVQGSDHELIYQVLDKSEFADALKHLKDYFDKASVTKQEISE